MKQRYVDQFKNFPSSSHDDHVDAISWVFMRSRRKWRVWFLSGLFFVLFLIFWYLNPLPL